MATRVKCSSCRRTALYVIRNAYKRSANGKPVCGSAICWGMLTDGYPAEGRGIKKTEGKQS